MRHSCTEFKGAPFQVKAKRPAWKLNQTVTFNLIPSLGACTKSRLVPR